MPKKKKSFSANKLTEKKQDTEEAKRRKRKNNTIITVVSILAVIAIVISIGYYLIYVMPMQRTIIKVNDESVKIDYLLKRCLMSSNPDDITSTRYQIAYELLIKQGAPEYGIEVTEADIDQAIRDSAKGTSEDITDAEVKEWYRQKLNQSQLSEKQYREYISISIMAERLQALLSDAVPTTAEQVHLHYIVVGDIETALDIKSRIEGGEDFATIAREVSLDADSAENGGDKGWIPVRALTTNFEYTVTDLDIGEISNPIAMGSGETTDTSDTTDANAPYAILMISEKAAAMEVTDEFLTILKGRVLQDWINERLKTQKITFHGQGASGGYDSVTESWLLFQIQKLKKSRGITATTTTTAAQY